MVTLSFLFWSNEIQNSHLCANIYVQYHISQCVFSAHTLGVIRFTDSDTSQYHASIKFLLPFFFSFSKARAYTRRDYISTVECLYPRVAIHATCVIPLTIAPSRGSALYSDLIRIWSGLSCMIIEVYMFCFTIKNKQNHQTLISSIKGI